mmetsp:Transcript_5397/g.9066  ORF Transcript_5397/g.9066 Transcript_5397/m.9066 type:complete len:107 (-) Transcript_5397:19-339(-)
MCGPRHHTVADLQANMPKDESRWVALDLEFNVKEFGVEQRKQKIVFLTFNPDSNTNSKERTTIMFKKGVMKKKITSKSGPSGVTLMEVAVQSWEDLTEAALIKKLK